MRLGLGIDTGGTYTDAVIMDMDTGEVLDKAKSMTTRDDLSIGIRGAIDALDPDHVDAAVMVALSSTLATNSVVEGKGCRVGLICIGGDYDMTAGADYSIKIAGRHDLAGNEEVPLDEAEAIRFMDSVKGKIEGLAVSGLLSVRNPEHEIRIRELARERLGIPVVCGYELTSSLGFVERTTTCVMNSRLIPVIDELITSMEAVMKARGIRAPLMIFRGDGTLMGKDVARERPVETILSGPAASLMGAVHLTGLKDAVVMDMGGTTTDIGILRDGRPHLEPEGAVIGGKRTRVMAAQIATSGIGGDSRIIVSEGEIQLTSLRVLPVCVAATKWPNVKTYFDLIKGFRVGKSKERARGQSTVFRIEFLRTVKMPRDPSFVGDVNMELLRSVSAFPKTLVAVCMETKRKEAEYDIAMLEDMGYLQRIGLTPTDILHADGSYERFDAEASRSAVEYMASICGMTPEEFVEDAKRRIREKLALELVDALMSEALGDVDFGSTGRELVMSAIRGNSDRVLGCSFRIDRPIIGIGAPSGVYIRWMADIFGTDVVIDGDSDVGNAIGAITSVVSEKLEVLIRPQLGASKEGAIVDGSGNKMAPIPSHGSKFEVRGFGQYQAYSKMGLFTYPSIEEAIADQEVRAREYVANEARRSYVEEPVVTVDVDRHRLAESLRMYDVDEVVLTATATGKPGRFRSGSPHTLQNHSPPSACIRKGH